MIIQYFSIGIFDYRKFPEIPWKYSHSPPGAPAVAPASKATPDPKIGLGRRISYRKPCSLSGVRFSIGMRCFNRLHGGIRASLCITDAFSPTREDQPPHAFYPVKRWPCTACRTARNGCRAPWTASFRRPACMTGGFWQVRGDVGKTRPRRSGSLTFSRFPTGRALKHH